ncbi:winged helix-turn-helix domain-containing protein [Lacimonas salitolerans]|uniref:Winged helix-turn-helix domain-containing protein n=1 Tax=Lacimonas salitolerans TaxID=1323750 RepID=A0ABW4EFC2_9RHOB
MTAPLAIPNRDARRLWLWSNGLAPAPTGPLDVAGTIRALGLLQIDTIRNVTRAHNHILWTRNQNYREGMLWPLLEQRRLFEHFTHDASLLPTELLPYWSVQFRRLGDRAVRAPWYQSGLGQAEVARIRDRIAQEGPLSTHAFDTKAESREMWARPPHKKALDQMWYAGTLATSHRQNFVKYYDLGARVFPDHDAPPEHEALTRISDDALNRLAIATPGEVQRFWAVATAPEIRDWAARAETVPVRVQAADGTWRDALAHPDIETRLAIAPAPTTRLRILNPFDPAIRDRARLERLFGFEYRNEMFVPADQRRWGYYVYPLLQGDRFVGRIEIKADRAAGWLRVTGFWPEPGVAWGAPRAEKLDAELARFARMVGLTDIQWSTARP